MENKATIFEPMDSSDKLDEVAWLEIESIFRKVFRRKVRMLPKDSIDKIICNVKSQKPVEVVSADGDMNIDFAETIMALSLLLDFVKLAYEYYQYRYRNSNMSIIINFNEFRQDMKNRSQWDETFEELQDEFQEICNMFKESD